MLKKYIKKEVEEYKQDVWTIKVKKSPQENIMIELSRNIKFSLLYWNVFGDCFKTDNEFKVTISSNINLFVNYFIEMERTISCHSENKKIPDRIKNYDCI